MRGEAVLGAAMGVGRGGQAGRSNWSAGTEAERAAGAAARAGRRGGKAKNKHGNSQNEGSMSTSASPRFDLGGRRHWRPRDLQCPAIGSMGEVAEGSSMRYRGCRSSSLERFGDDEGRGSDFLAGGSNNLGSHAVWTRKKEWRS